MYKLGSCDPNTWALYSVRSISIIPGVSVHKISSGTSLYSGTGSTSNSIELIPKQSLSLSTLRYTVCASGTSLIYSLGS